MSIIFKYFRIKYLILCQYVTFQSHSHSSPKTKTWLEGDVRYRTLKGKKVAVSGVATTDSIYYLWFEYLKRSEKYKKLRVLTTAKE